jgi:NAD(P)-dependent dehydrogenase (short-subunit alcohol dehydrogenase family)
MDVEGTTVIITGAASGIGAALARRFHAEGAAGLALFDVQDGPLTELADELGALAIVCDMADEDAVAVAVDRVEAELGPVDLCCSNAGIGGGGGVELPTAEWQRAWDVNVMAHVHLARVLVPRWIDRGHGHLMVTASAAGLLTQLGSAPYSVTKAAAVSFAEWVTITYGDHGVTASALCPQGVRTAMTVDMEDSVVALDGMLEADAVADAVVEGLADGRFLILPHPKVADYTARKGADRDRWIGGMRKLQRAFPDPVF